MTLSDQLFRPGDRYVLRFESDAYFDNHIGAVTGEVMLLVRDGAQGTTYELLPSVGFFGPGVQSSKGYTERLALQASGDQLWIEVQDVSTQWILDLALNGTLVAEGLMRDPEKSDQFRLERTGEDLYSPPADAILAFGGRLTGLLTVASTEGVAHLHLSDGVLALSATDDVSSISRIELRIQGVFGLDQRFFPPAQTSIAHDLAGAPPGPGPSIPMPAPAAAEDWRVAHSPRMLYIQRVFFAGNGAVTGGASDGQLAEATVIWAKACIAVVEAASPSIVANASLMQSAHIGAIVAAFMPPAGVVPVFFVDNILAGDGGGAVVNPGTALARVVVSDHTSGIGLFGDQLENPNLMAHELGHVLGGLHPNEQPHSALWQAEANSVMEARGVAWEPMPTRNPLHNCLLAYNVAAVPVQPVTADCFLQPDQ